MKPEEVKWVVNSLGELGVKIGEQFFFLYKGHSLSYDNDLIMDESCGPLSGKPMRWRHVYKREFGECCHPWQTIKQQTGKDIFPDNFEEAYGDINDWKVIPNKGGDAP